MDKMLVTMSEAAAMLGIGRSKLYELVNTGAIESVRIGRVMRIPVSSLHAFVEHLTAGHVEVQ